MKIVVYTVMLLTVLQLVFYDRHPQDFAYYFVDIDLFIHTTFTTLSDYFAI